MHTAIQALIVNMASRVRNAEFNAVASCDAAVRVSCVRALRGGGDVDVDRGVLVI